MFSCIQYIDTSKSVGWNLNKPICLRAAYIAGVYKHIFSMTTLPMKVIFPLQLQWNSLCDCGKENILPFNRSFKKRNIASEGNALESIDAKEHSYFNLDIFMNTHCQETGDLLRQTNLKDFGLIVCLTVKDGPCCQEEGCRGKVQAFSFSSDLNHWWSGMILLT